ncbi:MAG: hypothetical protein CSYNP_03578 [Syntrophus sp. SKADARSKE-3]|nr:hypothetical protein [Syntrophus sp. SKADARSKE-3]
MEINVRKEQNAVTVTAIGRIDTLSAPQFDQTLDNLIAEGDRCIIIDFELVDYISSAGLQTILAAAKRLEKLSGEIILLNLSGVVEETIELSGFDAIFRIFDNSNIDMDKI